MAAFVSSPGYTGPEKIRYLFIDGAYFRKVVQDVSSKYFKGVEIPVDYQDLSRGFTKTFYYDCLPAKKDSESPDEYEKRIKPIEELFDALMAIDGFHVYEGIAHGRKGRVRQKKVDMMLAIDMLTHASLRNMHEVTLLTGDLDFKPLIDALVRNGMYVTLWYEKSTTSKELIYSADARMPLSVRDICGWATSGFKKLNQLPYVGITSSKETENSGLIKRGKTELGDLIELYKRDKLYRIVFQDKRSGERFINVIFEDLEFLELYVKNEYSNFTWE